MTVNRKIMIRVAVLGGLGLGIASSVDAQRVCKRYGTWTLVNGSYVCAGNYTDHRCVWYDDCRVYVE